MIKFALCALILLVGAHTAAAQTGAPDARSVRVGVESKSQTYKGLEVTVAEVTRATNVSLADCPAGANTVRGVIKPGDTTEFAAVKIEFKVLPSFKAGVIPKPTLTDASGKVFNTAQSFGDVAVAQSFACTFAFRVPKGTKVTKLSIDTASLDLAGLEK
jgi:hypothetical protein